MTERRKPILLALVALLLGAAAGAGAGLRWDDWSAEPSYRSITTKPLMSYGMCAERRQPDPATATITVLFSTAFGTTIRDRRVEIRAQRHPEYGWIVWAELVHSRSDQDQLWLAWSYTRDPQDDATWRDCTQPLADGRATPAIHTYDDNGRARWFQACGRVPPHDRGPRTSGVFCTEWGRPT
ncbi:hypothetical protein [Nocardia crassostreae]|uniref:hypothetical protein n=1 Tax=Nocardia crassostreae TaxID=53428 RepID=UPI00082CE675|nr:hypothetical protein [Nocardia crassostreae]